MAKLNGSFKVPECACEYFECVMCQGLLGSYIGEMQCMEWTRQNTLSHDDVHRSETVKYTQISLPTSCTMFLYLFCTTTTCFGHIWPSSGS